MAILEINLILYLNFLVKIMTMVIIIPHRTIILTATTQIFPPNRQENLVVAQPPPHENVAKTAPTLPFKTRATLSVQIVPFPPTKPPHLADSRQCDGGNTTTISTTSVSPRQNRTPAPTAIKPSNGNINSFVTSLNSIRVNYPPTRIPLFFSPAEKNSPAQPAGRCSPPNSPLLVMNFSSVTSPSISPPFPARLTSTRAKWRDATPNFIPRKVSVATL